MVGACTIQSNIGAFGSVIKLQTPDFPIKKKNIKSESFVPSKSVTNLSLGREMLKFVCLILLAIGVCAILLNVACDERIIGGQFAAKGQFPYQVALRNNTGGHVCGGAIVHSRFILSSGNCVQYSTVQNISAFVGAYSLTDGTRHELNRITRHPNFNWALRSNDIAVLRTVKPIEFNDFVQPIALPTAAVEKGRVVLVAGWGTIYVSSLNRY